jgi:hypothetical protein
MANLMAQNECRQSGGMPIVAQACQNFLKRREIQQAAFAEAWKLANEKATCRESGAGASPNVEVNFPMLLGSKVQLVESQKNEKALVAMPSTTPPFGTPTSVGSPADRSLSFRSNASSSASTTYSVKNTFVHVDDSSESEALSELKRSASEPNLFKSQPYAMRQRMDNYSLTQPIVIEPLVSIGSVGHKTGNCRPCAWFWKAHGCENGLQCLHCHLCPSNEIKRRRYKKVAEKKKQKQRGLSQDANASESIMSSGGVTASVY